MSYEASRSSSNSCVGEYWAWGALAFPTEWQWQIGGVRIEIDADPPICRGRDPAIDADPRSAAAAILELVQNQLGFMRWS